MPCNIVSKKITIEAYIFMLWTELLDEKYENMNV